MLVRSIYEGIRMGSSDLSIPPKKDYTIGFEFEVALDTEDADEFDNDDFMDDFGPNVDTSEFMSSWFEHHILNRKLKEFVTDNDIEPTYGYTTLSETDIDDIQREFDDNLIEKYGEDTVDEIQETLLDIKEDPGMNLDEEQLYSIFNTYFKVARTSVNNVKAYIDQLVNSTKDRPDIEETLRPYLKVLNNTFLFDENLVNSDGVQIYANKNKSKTINFDDIHDMEDFITYFNVDTDDIELILEGDDAYQSDLEDMLADQNEATDTETDEIRTVRKLISSALQTSVAKHSSTTDWTVDEDGTIGVDAEIRSPILSIDQGYKDMNTVLDTIQNTDMYTTHATGLHINIGTWGSDEYNNIDWLKFLTIVNPSRILQQFSRSNNQYAMDKLQKMVDSLKEEDIKTYFDMLPSINASVIAASEKYSAINLSKLPSLGYIELRAPGNEGYEKRGDEITALIRKTIRALELAADPTAFKQQYLKKLFVLSTANKPTNAKPTNIYDFFVQHTNAVLVPTKPMSSLLTILDNIIRKNDKEDTVRNMDKTLTKKLSSGLINVIKTHAKTTPITQAEVDKLRGKLEQLPSNSITIKILTKITDIIQMSIEIGQTAPQATPQ